MTTLMGRFAARLQEKQLDFRETVLATSRIPYGRPAELSAESVLADWRGTCSTKHLLLVELVREAWPEMEIDLCHRVYRVTKELATERWGRAVAEIVPVEGLFDVHTYATAMLATGRTTIDVTFPVELWDGFSSMPLACGPGTDHAAGISPLETKAELVARYCDARLREPFIAALTLTQGQPSDLRPLHF